MLGYLSAHIICPSKLTVFRERSSRKTVGFEEQILMFKDKYPCMFLSQMEAIVVIILQIFFYKAALFAVEDLGQAVKHKNNYVGVQK